MRGVRETTCCPSMQILYQSLMSHRSFLNGVSSSCRWIVYDTASLLWTRVEAKMAGTIFEQNRKLKFFKNMHNTCFKGVVYLCVASVKPDVALLCKYYQSVCLVEKRFFQSNAYNCRLGAVKTYMQNGPAKR